MTSNGPPQGQPTMPYPSVGSPAVNSDRSEAPTVRPSVLERETPERREEFYALREGISDGLRPSLLDWTVPWYSSYVDDSWEIDLDRVRHLERVVDRWVLLVRHDRGGYRLPIFGRW